ncbi:MAG: hypothetical protein GY703_25650 [Gammaproteobacteria bacterium]|nr:hypothetical protein [Gammaproteobacteria bacterium]
MSAIGVLSIVLTMLDARTRSVSELSMLEQRTEMVRKMGLTDLALFIEARYTRHPSQADRHSAFQEHPLSLEHFPTGSFLPPSLHLTQ